MPYRAVFDPDRCVACEACAIACMDQNDTRVGVDPLLRTVHSAVIGAAGGEHAAYLSVACMHCPDAPCVSACPRGCYAQNPETGLVELDSSRCLGCHMCAIACPIDAIGFDVYGKPAKCTGCAERLSVGLRPACELACQTGALRFEQVEAEGAKAAEARDAAASDLTAFADLFARVRQEESGLAEARAGA